MHSLLYIVSSLFYKKIRVRSAFRQIRVFRVPITMIQNNKPILNKARGPNKKPNTPRHDVFGKIGFRFEQPITIQPASPTAP